MDSNPYTSPASDLQAQGQAPGAEVDDALIDLLARTKPWVRVVGVLLWIAVGMMLLAAFFIIVASALGGAALGKGDWSPAMMLAMAVLYMALSGVYIYPARRIWNYGSAIMRLTQSRRLADLHAALDAQRAFWTFVGISLLVLVGVYALALVIAVVVGVMSALAGH